MLSEVVLRWSGEGEKVQVAGSWNDWKPEELIKEEDCFILRLNLPPGKYQLKWVIDNVWKLNQDLPVVVDGEGNENNEIEVKSAVSDTGSQESLDDWETLEIPAEEEIEISSPVAPKVEITPGTPEANVTEVPLNQNQSERETSNITSMTTSVKEESISVVERIFNVDHATTIDALKSNGAELLEEEEFEDEYWDTEDFKLTRRGLWLRLRRMEGSSGSECWQLRKLEHQSKLNLVTEERAVANRLKEELGMEGAGEPEVTEVLLSNHFKKMLAFHGSKSRWRIGVVEVEVRRENKMDTAVVKVVGEVMAALQELHSNAEMLHLMPLHVRTFGAGGGGVVSGAA